jgi:hypothetical protein
MKLRSMNPRQQKRVCATGSFFTNLQHPALVIALSKIQNRRLRFACARSPSLIERFSATCKVDERALHESKR